MATRYWLGTEATEVQQVANATFGTYDTATTRKITIGDKVISAVDSGGTLTAALSALATLLNASVHPYFAAITWTSNATQIIGTADTAGCPFVFTASVTGGTGTCSNAYTVATANQSAHDWNVAANWSGATVPVGGDTVIIKDTDVDILWNLDQSAVTLAALYIHQSFTGKIGLDRTVFPTSHDGETLDTTGPYTEYRDCYLKISATIYQHGINLSPSSNLTGSPRCLINLGSNASTIEVFNVGTPSEEGRPALRLLNVHASSLLYVRYAPGGVGLAVDAPGEVSTVSVVSISDTSDDSRVFAGPGCTITTWSQQGGTNILQAAATVTTVTVNGGTLQSEGDYTITTANCNGGTFYSNQIKTGGNAITTANVRGGTLNGLQSNQARTWATVNFFTGSVQRDGSVVTITTLTAQRCNLQNA